MNTRPGLWSTAVILSEAKDLQFRGADELQILRFAQDDGGFAQDPAERRP